MDQALLLRAFRCIVGGIEVRDEDAGKPSKHSFQNGAFPCWRVNVGDFLHVREGPYITGLAFDRDLGFVGVDQWPAPKFVLQTIICTLMLLRGPRFDSLENTVGERESE